jgi:hypothetical protein
MVRADEMPCISRRTETILTSYADALLIPCHSSVLNNLLGPESIAQPLFASRPFLCYKETFLTEPPSTTPQMGAAA